MKLVSKHVLLEVSIQSFISETNLSEIETMGQGVFGLIWTKEISTQNCMYLICSPEFLAHEIVRFPSYPRSVIQKFKTFMFYHLFNFVVM